MKALQASDCAMYFSAAVHSFQIELLDFSFFKCIIVYFFFSVC